MPRSREARAMYPKCPQVRAFLYLVGGGESPIAAKEFSSFDKEEIRFWALGAFAKELAKRHMNVETRGQVEVLCDDNGYEKARYIDVRVSDFLHGKYGTPLKSNPLTTKPTDTELVVGGVSGILLIAGGLYLVRLALGSSTDATTSLADTASVATIATLL